MSDVLARDMSRKINDTIKSAIMREMSIASHVLQPADLIWIMMGLAKGALTSAAATVAANVPLADRQKFYLETIEHVATLAREGWSEAELQIRQQVGKP